VNGEGKPVVAIDIDGTLGDYHRNFIQFARLYFGDTESNWMRDNPGLPLWEHMGISKRDYRDAKLAYRQGGWKRWMPAYDGVAELTAGIRKAGAELWICTTRPYLRLDNVDPDTREWLRRNNIQYDALLFDPQHEEDGTKYHELYRQVGGDRIASIVDDLPEMIEAADYLRIPKNSTPILRDQPYNRHLTFARRANSTAAIWVAVSADLKRWLSRNSD
jgi:hypothetical protein